MDYSQEAITSLIWILQTLAITSVVFSFGIFLLVRFTQWGRQFWMFAGGYLSPKRSIKPILFFLLIVAMTLLSVRISLVHSEWYKNMYTSLQEFNEHVFWQQMGLFCVIAASSVSAALVSYYLEQRFVINWIEWLNEQLVDKWMAHRAYYKTQYLSENLDNPDQRIQQDVQSYVKTTLSLSTGVIDAVTSMIYDLLYDFIMGISRSNDGTWRGNSAYDGIFSVWLCHLHNPHRILARSSINILEFY